MGKTSTVEYKGALRTNAVHLRSGNDIITDAPVDNNGKGEAFSPTDLVATALASCMVTIMGIRADKMGVDITGAEASVQKIMASGPRRIEKIVVDIHMPHGDFESKHMKVLEEAAKTCPVALTLHPDTKQVVNFHWS